MRICSPTGIGTLVSEVSLLMTKLSILTSNIIRCLEYSEKDLALGTVGWIRTTDLLIHSPVVGCEHAEPLPPGLRGSARPGTQKIHPRSTATKEGSVVHGRGNPIRCSCSAQEKGDALQDR